MLNVCGTEIAACHPTLRALNAGSCPVCDVSLDDELAKARAELALLDRDAALADLGEFVRQGWHVLESVELEWNWHHDALCRNVQGMLDEWLRVRDERSEIKRRKLRRRWRMRWQKLVLNICPSSLKSRIVMVFAVAWMWLKDPAWTVLCTSSNPENVRRDAESCRDLISSDWYRGTFDVRWKVRGDIDSKGKFALDSGGYRISKGLVSKITGIHVDCHLHDDPDDAQDVHSEAERKARAGKMQALSSRFADKRVGVTIVLQQRVHVDDETGRLLASGGVLHASYPLHYRAARRADTPFFKDPRTVEGENLHAERFTPEVIAAAKIELGTQGYNAQYEMDPAPSEGNMFKAAWFRFFRIVGIDSGMRPRPPGTTNADALLLETTPDGKLVLDWLSITADCTFGSVSDNASAVSLQVIGGKGPKRFVFLDKTRPMTYPETRSAITNLILEWTPRVRCGVRVLVEKKANGQAIIDELSIQFPGLIPIDPEGGKEARASAMSPAVESGCVYLLEGADWLDEYVGEIIAFPHGKRDDRVDALSQAMNFHRADLDAMRFAAKTAALLSLRKGQPGGVVRI